MLVYKHLLAIEFTSNACHKIEVIQNRFYSGTLQHLTSYKLFKVFQLEFVYILCDKNIHVKV